MALPTNNIRNSYKILILLEVDDRRGTGGGRGASEGRIRDTCTREEGTCSRGSSEDSRRVSEEDGACIDSGFVHVGSSDARLDG